MNLDLGVREAAAALTIDGVGAAYAIGEPAPSAWDLWAAKLFPAYTVHPMAQRHVEFWEHAWSIEPDSAPDPFVAVWTRGGGKTTTGETICTALGVRDKRFYAWYVSETQDKADKNVENVGAQLETDEVETYYPKHASRKVGKYGSSRGWRRNRLRTAGGFTVDAVGLDTAARGMKVEEQRPDLIIIDDIDGKHDTLATTAKKIETITTSLIPAGSPNCAIIIVQNLIIPHGVVTQLVDGRAEFLFGHTLSGPHPAIEGFEYGWEEFSDGTRRPVITKGVATWEGQSLEVCQRTLEAVGPVAFLKEYQHRVKELAEGVVLDKFDQDVNTVEWKQADIQFAIAEGKLRPFAGIDYGLWRFAFLLLAADRAGRVHVLDEYYSQRETLTVRARAIHDMLAGYGIENLLVYGDPANPTDSLEMNAALEAGWVQHGEYVQPRWRAVAATKDKGSRLTGPDRINDLYESRSLLVRKTIGARKRWHHGMNASSPGKEVVGSRFLWEQETWSFPNPHEGRAQDQNPDDNTADGADMMAAFRYAIMSHLDPPSYSMPDKVRQKNRDYGYDDMAKEIAKRHQLTGA